MTTSTTEAEPLALSQTTREGMFISRLLRSLHVKVNNKLGIVIHCDNQQTIKLVKMEIGLLNSRLRHVDIHNHWLRQEVEKGTIRVEYVPSGDMIADGLTKVLTNTSFAAFIQQLGLVDIADRLQTTKAPLDLTAAFEHMALGPDGEP